MFGIIPLWLVAAGVGYVVAQENPILGWCILIGVTVGTVLLIGAPAVGLAMVGLGLGLLALYIFIRLLPFIIGLAIGMAFVVALVAAIGTVTH